MRLILVPQYPAQLRYQEWWWTEFPKQLSEYFEVIVLGSSFVRSWENRGATRESFFSPIELSIDLELNQVAEFMQLRLEKDDVLLLNDISFPGIFANVLFHKRPKKCFAICHATSRNKYDYFGRDRRAKFPVEKGISKLFNAVFVGSGYHLRKLGWQNIAILRFPDPPFPRPEPPLEKNGIGAVSRKGVQKRTSKLERRVEEKFGKITYLNSKDWAGYYYALKAFQVMLITSKEETYGYQVVDAINCGCIPVAPNSLSYPELLPPEYLYNNGEEMLTVIQKALDGGLPVLTELKTSERSKTFYQQLATRMKV